MHIVTVGVNDWREGEGEVQAGVKAKTGWRGAHPLHTGLYSHDGSKWRAIVKNMFYSY